MSNPRQHGTRHLTRPHPSSPLDLNGCHIPQREVIPGLFRLPLPAAPLGFLFAPQMSAARGSAGTRGSSRVRLSDMGNLSRWSCHAGRPSRESWDTIPLVDNLGVCVPRPFTVCSVPDVVSSQTFSSNIPFSISHAGHLGHGRNHMSAAVPLTWRRCAEMKTKSAGLCGER